MSEEKLVTETELDRVLSFLAELRTSLRNDNVALHNENIELKDSNAELSKQSAELSRQMMEGFQEVTRRQDVANGKLMTHEGTITVLSKNMTSLSGKVDVLNKFGCAQKWEHVTQLNALAAVGVLPEVVLPDVKLSDVSSRPRWIPNRKKVGITGGVFGLGALTAYLTPEVIKGIVTVGQTLFHLFKK